MADDVLDQSKVVQVSSGKTDAGHLACWMMQEAAPQEALDRLRGLNGVTSVRQVAPLYPFRDTGEAGVPFATLAELEALATGTSLPDAALLYESRRTGKGTAEVFDAFEKMLAIMRQAEGAGLTGNAELLGGFCPGNDGRRLIEAYRAKRTVSGGILLLATARALGVMEVNGAMGRVVATPTAGSAGVLPAVVLSVGERLDKSDEQLVQGLLVAAAVGVCIANKASLSGAVGGCQAEIGVAAAIAGKRGDVPWWRRCRTVHSCRGADHEEYPGAGLRSASRAGRGALHQTQRDRRGGVPGGGGHGAGRNQKLHPAR